MKSRDVVVGMDSEINQLRAFISDAIALKILRHVKNLAESFPSVRGSM